jgi:hypothetical protein
MAGHPLTDPRPAAAATKAAKKTQALVREARFLLRRADKVTAAAGAIDDPATHQLAAEVGAAVERLTQHLVRLERQQPPPSSRSPSSPTASTTLTRRSWLVPRLGIVDVIGVLVVCRPAGRSMLGHHAMLVANHAIGVIERFAHVGPGSRSASLLRGYPSL